MGMAIEQIGWEKSFSFRALSLSDGRVDRRPAGANHRELKALRPAVSALWAYAQTSNASRGAASGLRSGAFFDGGSDGNLGGVLQNPKTRFVEVGEQRVLKIVAFRHGAVHAG